MRGHEKAIATWKRLVDGTEEGVVSCLSMFELDRLSLRGAIEQCHVLLEAIPHVCKVGWLQNGEGLSRAARLSRGVGIPAIDSLILATFEENQASTILTTDSHLKAYKRKGAKVVLL